MKKLFLLIWLLLLCGVSFASYISMDTSITTKVVNNTLRVTISAQNNGDEPAYNVQAELQVNSKRVLLKKAPIIVEKGYYKARTNFKLKDVGAGEHPIILYLHYADANRYPFTALICQKYNYKTEGLPQSIFANAPSVGFWKKGSLSLTVKNIDDQPRKVLSTLIIPRELSVEKGVVEYTILAKAEKKIKFNLKNFSALSGSSYNVYVISTYNKDGLELATISPVRIDVSIDQSKINLGLWVVVGLSILLIILISFYFIRISKKNV
jgi:hypothetical protein